MTRLTKIIYALIICLLVTLALAIYHYRANAIKYKKQRDVSYQELGLAKKTILDMQARQRDVAALDARYTKELADAKARLSYFEQCVRDGKCGLRINAACQRVAPPSPPAWMMQPAPDLLTPLNEIILSSDTE